MAERPVVLTLAHPRARWSRRLTTWTTTGAIDLHHQPCLTVSEVRRRVAEGGARAVLADARLAQDGSDLAATASAAGVALIRVHADAEAAPTDADRDRSSLATNFAPNDLLAVLPPAGPRTPPRPPSPQPTTTRTGRVIAVTGAGGSGVSTIAALVAGAAGGPHRSALLADLSDAADQALRHGLADVVPGLAQALAEDERLGRALPDCVQRGVGDHDVLAGVPFGHVVDLEPRRLGRVLDAARATYDHTVIDLPPATLVALGSSGGECIDRVIVVARPDAAGVHRLCRLAAELSDSDAPDTVVVLNCVAPRPRATGPVIAATRHLLAASGLDPSVPIVRSRHRFGLEGRLRDGRAVRRPGPRSILTRAALGS